MDETCVSFDDAAFKAGMATFLSIDANQIEVNTGCGARRLRALANLAVTATIVASDATEGASVVDDMTAVVSDTTALQTALGMTVNSARSDDR